VRETRTRFSFVFAKKEKRNRRSSVTHGGKGDEERDGYLDERIKRKISRVVSRGKTNRSRDETRLTIQTTVKAQTPNATTQPLTNSVLYVFLISLTQSRSLKSGAALNKGRKKKTRSVRRFCLRLDFSSSSAKRSCSNNSRNITSQSLPRMTFHLLLDESCDLGVPKGDEGGGGRGEA